jgi:ATP-binding cassette subfamily C protein
LTSFSKTLSLFSRSERRQLPWLLIASIVMAFLEVIGIASVMPFLALVANPNSLQTNSFLRRTYEIGGFSSARHFMFFAGASVLGLLIVTNGFTAFTTWMLYRFSWLRNHSLSCRLLRKYLFEDYSFFLMKNSTDLSANILSEIAQVTNGILVPGITMIAKAIVAAAIIGLLVCVNPLVAALLSLLLGGAYTLVYILFRKRLTIGGECRLKMNAARYKIASEAFGGIKDIKLLGKEEAFLQRYTGPSREYALSQASGNSFATLPRYVMETVAFGGILVIALALLVTGGNIQGILPLMGLYALAGYRLMPALQQVFSGVATVRYSLAALDILHEELRGASEAPAEGLGIEASLRLDLEHTIELRNIRFAYLPERAPLFRDLTLTIEANTTIGFAGTTGSGKTTLVDIIMGLLKPNGGELDVDGRPITSTNVRSWQRSIGYVPQQIYLCDDTIARNIALGLPAEEVDMDAVMHAAGVANLHDFITGELPHGYDTMVGERGVRLSGGQRQRIGIARALYHDPSLLVLDEATSALDNVTENVVMDALQCLANKKTVIMIAHRISTLRECDVIYLMKNGEIVAQGTYANLMHTDANFRELAHPSRV